MSTATAIPPNQTLYINNLNDKIRKPDLRISLYMLFSTYGVVLDVVALKTMKHRGQAHIAFRDVASATQAMRALQGMDFYGKDMKIAYAKGKSDAIAKLDGTYKIPQPTQHAGDGKPFVALPGTGPVAGQKRPREEEEPEDEDDEGEEMEMDDD